MNHIFIENSIILGRQILRENIGFLKQWKNKYIDFYKFNDLIQHCNKNEKKI